MVISEPLEFVYVSNQRCGSHTMFCVLCERYGGVHRKEFGYHCRVVPEQYETWFTFSTCRNPYSRAVSIWRATTKGVSPYTKRFPFAGLIGSREFPAFARWLPEGGADPTRTMCWPQHKVLSLVRLDDVLHIENLDEEAKRLPFWDGPDHIEPWTNQTHESQPDWKTLYTDELAECIQEWAGSDFERFGYSLTSYK